MTGAATVGFTAGLKGALCSTVAGAACAGAACAGAATGVGAWATVGLAAGEKRPKGRVFHSIGAAETVGAAVAGASCALDGIPFIWLKALLRIGETPSSAC
jgi:hypothetical protein